MKTIVTLLAILSLSIAAFAQSKEAITKREVKKQYTNNKDNLTAFSQKKSVDAVKNVLKQYNTAVEKLNVTGTEKLFTADSKMYESGGREGSYEHYLEHHLAPELKEFKSFTYGNYKVEVQIEDNFAFATETYNYTIVLLKDNSEIKRKGISTSVLKKVKDRWKIMISHNSSRK